MNRFLIPSLLILLAAALGADPTPDQARLAEEIVLGYYTDQAITDDTGVLLSSIVVEQEIRSIEDGVESVVKAHLFMKDDDTYLVYLKNSRNESVCYLYRGDEQWVYRENLNNPLRVNMSQNVSGMANLGDLIGINILEDFLLESVRDTSAGYVLRFNRARSSYPYPVILVTADADTRRLKSIEYQGLGNRSMRRVDLEEYTRVSGSHLIPVWRISNLVTDIDDLTEIRYLSIKPIDIPGGYFSPTGNALSHFIRWSDRLLH